MRFIFWCSVLCKPHSLSCRDVLTNFTRKLACLVVSVLIKAIRRRVASQCNEGVMFRCVDRWQHKCRLSLDWHRIVTLLFYFADMLVTVLILKPMFSERSVNLMSWNEVCSTVLGFCDSTDGQQCCDRMISTVATVLTERRRWRQWERQRRRWRLCRRLRQRWPRQQRHLKSRDANNNNVKDDDDNNNNI